MSAVVKRDGTLWTWGNNAADRLNFDGGFTGSRPSPEKIMDGVVSVSVGSRFTLAINTDGTLWAWEANRFGEGTTMRLSPVKIMDDVISVSTKSGHAMAIKTDGSLWVWGSNDRGQIGDGSINVWDGNRLVENNYRSSPVKIMDNVASISAGYLHSMAVKNDGSLWAWGLNNHGQLGDGTMTSRLSPVKIMDNVASVSAGFFYTFAIKTDGTLWAWGSGNMLGDGNWENRLSPVKIMDNVASVSAGGNIRDGGHSAAIKTDGTLWAWGSNSHGQIGNGSGGDYADRRPSPVKIMDNVASVSAGGNHTIAVKHDGSLWAWGDNKFGQIGDGFVTVYGEVYRDGLPQSIKVNNNDRLTPVKIMDNVLLPGDIPSRFIDVPKCARVMGVQEWHNYRFSRR
jgi:alpha-tubulin suppressor-like RCC1 family protein